MRKSYLLFLSIATLLFLTQSISAAPINISETTAERPTEFSSQRNILEVTAEGTEYTHVFFLNSSNQLVWMASNDSGTNWGTNAGKFNDSEPKAIYNFTTYAREAGSFTSDRQGNIYSFLMDDANMFIKGSYNSTTKTWDWNYSHVDSQMDANIKTHYSVITDTNTIEVTDYLNLFTKKSLIEDVGIFMYVSKDGGDSWGNNSPNYDNGSYTTILDGSVEQFSTTAKENKVHLVWSNFTNVMHTVIYNKESEPFSWGNNTPLYNNNEFTVISNSSADNGNTSTPSVTATTEKIHVAYTSTNGLIYRNLDVAGGVWSSTTKLDTFNYVGNNMHASIGSNSNKVYIVDTTRALEVGGIYHYYTYLRKSTDQGSSWNSSLITGSDNTFIINYTDITIEESGSETNGLIWYSFGGQDSSNDKNYTYIGYIANCNCPVSGNWIITEKEYCYNGECILNGNLNTSGSIAELTLKNYTIKLNSSTDGEFGIKIPAGKFNVERNSNITALNTSNAFTFKIVDNGYLNFDNSYLSYCGYDDSTLSNTGLFHNDYITLITDSTIKHNYNGIIISAGSLGTVWIRNNTIYNNTHNGIVISSDQSYPAIWNNNITENQVGVLITNQFDDDSMIYRNHIYNNSKSQLNHSACGYLYAGHNYWGSTNFTEINSSIIDKNSTCSNPRNVEFCPIWNSNDEEIGCPGDPCNSSSDCVVDHQVCIPDYDGGKFCGAKSTVNNLIYNNSPLTYFNATITSCAHNNRLYNNGTTRDNYTALSQSYTDINSKNWSCYKKYWTEDSFYNLSASDKRASIIRSSPIHSSGYVNYLQIPQLSLPNSSVYFAEMDLFIFNSTSEFTTKVDIGMDGNFEYDSSNLADFINSPTNISFKNELNTFLENCNCTNCSTSGDGLCRVGINISTNKDTGTFDIGLSHLKTGICQMKGQTCTYNQTTGEEGLCYGVSGSDTELRCRQTCTSGPECQSRGEGTTCCSFNVCAANLEQCGNIECGKIGDPCCAGNICSSGTCLCLAGQSEPQCVDPTTSKYRIFNISGININNTAYYTYENSTGDINSCCLSKDNSSCRGWKSITAS